MFVVAEESKRIPALRHPLRVFWVLACLESSHARHGRARNTRGRNRKHATSQLSWRKTTKKPHLTTTKTHEEMDATNLSMPAAWTKWKVRSLLNQGLVHTRIWRRKKSALFQDFSSFEGPRAISKPAPNPGAHQTPVETLSEKRW